MTDLPFGRGGSPLQNLLSRGIYKTKISALKVVEEMDAGPIYAKSELDISTGSAEDIYKRAADIIFQEMIPYIIMNEPVPQPQAGKVVSFRRRNEAESELPGFDGLQKVYDHIRMLDAEGYPQAFLVNNGFKYKFSKARMLPDSVKAEVMIVKEGNKGRE